MKPFRPRHTVKNVRRKKYERSEVYRTQYIRSNPGYFGKYYLCSYCGRIMLRSQMQVDHIVAINLANVRPIYRMLIPSDGINSIRNLTASCKKCNYRKSDKGGKWVIWGKLGRYVYPVVWVLILLSAIGFAAGVLSGYLTPQLVRSVIDSAMDFMLSWIQTALVEVAQEIHNCVTPIKNSGSPLFRINQMR